MFINNKKYSEIIFVIRASRVLVGIMLAQHYISIGPVDECYLGSDLSAAVPANTGQSPSALSMLFQRRRVWVDNETALGKCHVFADMLQQSIQQTCNVGLVLGQRRR